MEKENSKKISLEALIFAEAEIAGSGTSVAAHEEGEVGSAEGLEDEVSFPKNFNFKFLNFDQICFPILVFLAFFRSLLLFLKILYFFSILLLLNTE
jgi:hypothetical protein